MLNLFKHKAKKKFTISIIHEDHIFSQQATDFVDYKDDEYIHVIDENTEYKFHRDLVHSVVITSY